MTSLFADTLPSMPQLRVAHSQTATMFICVRCYLQSARASHASSTKCRVALSEEQCAMVNSIACQNLFQQAVNALIADYVAGCITSARSRLL
jgi:hypothetical protein